VDSTDPIGPAKALFGAEFYRNCKRSLAAGGLLVAQNGIPFVQGDELRRSMAHLRGIFADAAAYLATTPTYVGGPMAFGWASDNETLRQVALDKLRARFDAAGLVTHYYTAQVHAAAFALPRYVRDMIELGD
jgi:spermidine synthase